MVIVDKLENTGGKVPQRAIGITVCACVCINYSLFPNNTSHANEYVTTSSFLIN